MTRLRRHAFTLLFGVVFAAGWVVLQAGASAPAQPAPPSADARQLFVTGCSSCHGIDGDGTGQGPSLRDSGAASAYYYLSTGRMPLADDQAQPRRKRPVYSPAEIDLLVGYIASLGRAHPSQRFIPRRETWPKAASSTAPTAAPATRLPASAAP